MQPVLLTLKLETKAVGKCIACEENKPTDEYTPRNSKVCKTCLTVRNAERRRKTRKLVQRWKMIKGCQRCGFKAECSSQLDLDHNDPKTKSSKESGAYVSGWSKKRIKEELSKCTVLCKNCHALRTYREGHWKNEKSTTFS